MEMIDAYIKALELRAATTDDEIRNLTNEQIYLALTKKLGTRPKRAFNNPTEDLAIWRVENES